MFNLSEIKGVIFDYGGTIDSNGKHWAEVLWDSYLYHKVPVAKDQFREAYVYAERHLATNQVIDKTDNFFILLKKKVKLQIDYLESKGCFLKNNESEKYALGISEQCYSFVKTLLSKEILILEVLKERYPMVLVSNFYGNVESVLKDFDLLQYFDTIVESAVVGIRKPNPAIFSLGVEALALDPSSVVVIGDSYTKDIEPATSIGCQTIWLKGLGWGDDKEDARADLIITDFMELKSAFQLD